MSPEPAPPSAPPTVAESPVLRNSNFLRILAAGIASQGGSAVASVAIVWVVFADTGSALDVGLVAAATTIASIGFSLPMGVWVDRYDRRRLMVLSDVARGAAVGLLALVLALVGFDLVLVVGVSALVGAATVLFTPAEQSFLPSIVHADQLANANGLVRSTRDIVRVVGISGGGALVLLAGAAGGLFLNSATFAVSAALVSLVVVSGRGASPTPRPSHAERQMGAEIADGMRWLWRSEGLFQLSVSAGPMNFFSTLAGTFFVVYTTTELGGSVLTYALFLGVLAVGSAVGALLVGRTRATDHAGKVWILGYGIGGGGSLLALGFVPSILPAFVAAFAYGATEAYAGSTWLTAAQRLVPVSMQGRYFAVDGILSWAILPPAQVAGAFLVADIGIAETFRWAGIGLLASGVVSMLGRELWRLSTRDAAPDAGGAGAPSATRLERGV